MKTFLRLVAGNVLLLFLSLPAFAQDAACAPYKVVTERLYSEYKEQRSGAGLTRDGRLFEIWQSKNGRTWTMFFTHPETGVSCMVAAGQDWQPFAVVERGPGA